MLPLAKDSAEQDSRVDCMHEQANAIKLLERRTDPEWDLAMGPYWDSLPEPGALMTKEMMPAGALPFLQDSTMVRTAPAVAAARMSASAQSEAPGNMSWLPEQAPACAQPAFVRVHQDFTRSVLRGGKPEIVRDMRARLGRELPLEDFKYWTALVRTLGAGGLCCTDGGKGCSAARSSCRTGATVPEKVAHLGSMQFPKMSCWAVAPAGGVILLHLS